MQEGILETNSSNGSANNKLSATLLFNEKYQDATQATITFKSWSKVFKPISMLSKLIQT